MKLLQNLKLVCFSVLVLGFAPIALADSISPTSFDATISVGDSVVLPKTVTVTETLSTGVIDVMFLMDTTGSMGGVISTAKTQASSILTGLGTFGDLHSGTAFYDDPTFGITRALSDNDANTQAGINAYSASGGGDFPERGYNGLLTTLNDTAWRTGSNRFIVMFGDASDKDPGLQGAVVAALGDKNVNLLAVSSGGSAFTNAYGPVGLGARSTTYSFGADLTNIIKDAVTASFSTYSSVCLDTLSAPAGVLTTSAPVCHTGSWDRSVERTFDFDVTFTGVTPGDYAFPIYATVDGGRVATEDDRICVAAAGATDCASVPEPGSLGLLGLGMLMLGVRRYKLKVARS